MRLQHSINITIHCSVCGEKLSAVMYEPPDYDFGLCVEPCKTCGITQRAVDAACAFDHVKLALDGHSTCPACGAIPPRTLT
jgi:hypothetical protein